MTDSRRPDDARLSTADLAAATDRAKDRANERVAEHSAAQPARPQPQMNPQRPADRDVTHEVRQAHADAVADAKTADRAHDGEDRGSPLFAGNETEDFRRRWNDIQTGFVDEPRQSVERADALVASAIKRLAEIFAQERGNLEQQWSRGGDVSTEDLRVALRRYRGFFDRLLSV